MSKILDANARTESTVNPNNVPYGCWRRSQLCANSLLPEHRVKIAFPLLDS